MRKKLTEQWRPIPDWFGYEVSNFGRVKSFRRGAPKILKPGINQKGYHIYCLCNNNDRKMVLVSRLVATLFIPNPQDKPEVNHIDFDKDNNRITNLEWATEKENLYHAIIHEMKNKKLTHSQAHEIRNLAGVVPSAVLADKYNVAQSTIKRIQNGNRRPILNIG